MTDSKGLAITAVFSPDGKQIVTGGEEWNTLRVFDSESGKQRTAFGVKDMGTFRDLAISPDGKRSRTPANLYVIKNAHGGRLVLWDRATGKARSPFPDVGKAYLSAAFSPDGKLVAVRVVDGHVRVYDLATEKERLAIAAHACVFMVRFTPDGKHLISCGSQGDVKMWDVANGKQVAEFKGQKGSNLWVGGERRWQHVAAGSEDGMVRMWEIGKLAHESWRCKRTTRPRRFCSHPIAQPSSVPAAWWCGCGMWQRARSNWNLRRRKPSCRARG